MTDRHIEEIKKIILSLQGKNCFLITKSGLHYRTNDILLLGDSISFSDKFGYRVMIAISEISQLSEVRQ